MGKILDLIADVMEATAKATAKYQAAIAILEDPNNDNFWKRRALIKVFERP